jgi:hypothetical protein
VETESVAVHEEVPKEEAEVKTVRALKKRYGDQHLAVGRHQQLKKWTQGDGGSRKKLATARGGLTPCTIPVLRNGHSHQQGVATSPGDVETCIFVICAYNYRHLDMLAVTLWSVTVLNQSQSPWVSYRIAFVWTNHRAPITSVFKIQNMAAWLIKVVQFSAFTVVCFPLAGK